MKNIVIIPTYNEKNTIESLVRKIFEIQSDIHILIVDDNSPDGTQMVVDKLMKEFPLLNILKRKGKEGLGKAYTEAFRLVLKDSNISTIITMDADLSHDPKYIPIMLEKRLKYDFIIGSRYIKGGATEGWELWRKVLSFFGNIYTRIVTRIPLYDITAGFGAISADKLRNIDLNNIDSSGYAFLIELKYFLYKSGAKMIEIPIVFKNRIGGESKISNHIISEGIKAPWRLVLCKYNKKIECIICESDILHSQYTHKNGFSLYKCNNCKTIKVYPLSNLNIDIYNDNYFSGASHGFGYIDYDKDKEAMKDVFVGYIKRIDDLFRNKEDKKKIKLLDVGAATGYFMDIARGNSFDVTGIEISSDAVNKGKEKGLNIFNGTMENFDPKGKKFDVITLLDVIEHVPDPDNLILKCKDLLNKDGIIVINTPDSGSPYARLLGKRWHLIVPPEHLYYFNRKSLISLLRKNGFNIINSTTIGKKFTMEYVFLTLNKWLKLKVFWKIALFMKNNPKLGHISIPINLRDNMFITARYNKKT